MNFNNPEHIFVIAEAGSNWKCGTYDDDLNQAKNLIDIASKAGADAVKFQTYKPETTYVSDAGISQYLSKSGNTKKIEDIFEEHSMPYEMIPELYKYCKEKNIMFMSTPFSIIDAKAIDPYVEIHKIASFEINHVRLIEFLAQTNKPILVSTGASTFDEIDFCLDLLKKNGCTDIILLQCTSKYPCSISSLNLTVIPKMKSKYNLPIGLSDHSIDPIMGPLTSIGLGSTIIEKHFTLNKSLNGPDHAFALEPNELEYMIKSIRQIQSSFGSGIKEILEDEKELRQFATRSIQAIKNIEKDEILVEGKNFDILRPGNRLRGIESRFLESINGKKSTKFVQKGDGITDYYE